MILGSEGLTRTQYLVEFFMAPINNPEILSEALPLIMGSIVLATFFGRQGYSEFGRADSIGNSALWLTTAIALYLGNDLGSREFFAVTALFFFGLFTLYLDFSENVPRFLVFLTALVGPANALAYLIVILVTTPLNVNPTSIEAGIIFVIIAGLGFKGLRYWVPSKGGRIS